jgi:hypothetical protein
MISLKTAVILMTLVVATLADKPSPTYKRESTANSKEAVTAATEKTIVNAKVVKAEERQDQYGAPAIEQYGAPAIETYGAPAQEQYGAPAAPAQESYGAPKAPAQDSYGSPSAPVQEAYGAPKAPAYSAPAAAPSEVGTQGYYYYYYPVSTSPVQAPAKPSYAPPRQGFAGGNNALANIGIPIGVIIIVGIGIAIGIGILIAVASSTTTTTTTGRSLVNYLTDNMDDVTQIVYNGIKLYSQLNSRQ